MSDDTVIIDDEDEDTVHITKMHAVMAPTTETIELDDESGSEDEAKVIKPDANNTNISTDKTISKKEKKFVSMLKGNNLIDKIVKLCLNMENAVGMPRVINKTLLPLYKDANQKLKSSPAFRKLLKKTLKLLQMDPDHKFLHIKTLCERIKSGNIKRKVPFVTLATNLKHNHSVEDKDTERTSRISNSFLINNSHDVTININTYNERTEGNNSEFTELINTKISSKTNFRKKRCKRTYGNIMSKRNRNIMINTTEDVEVIDLDNSDTECVSTLHNQELVSNNNEEDKFNKVKSNILKCDANSIISVERNLENGNPINVGKSGYDLLIPSTDLKKPKENKDTSAKILELEKNLVLHKKKIAELEEAEVDNDSFRSPYIQCNNYKLKLLQCYKQLSMLKGCSTDIAKRREIRINVGEGRTSGPAKLLETRLNNSIDSTGTVAFPDFCDVVECVQQFNMEDNRGWSKQEIFKRATTLFRRCGESLRKNRQKREYKDLLGWVPQKAQMEDPAEKDPRLQATLEENKLIAQAKEQEIMDRYVNMENSLFAAKTLRRSMEFELHQTSCDSENTNTLLINNVESYGDTETMNDGPLEKVLVVDGFNSLSNIRNFVFCVSDNSLYNDNLEIDIDNKTDEGISKANNSSVFNESITNILRDNSTIASYTVIMNDQNDCASHKTILQDCNPRSIDICTSDMTVPLPLGISSHSNSALNSVSNDSDIDFQNSDKVSLPGQIHIEKVENYVPRIEYAASDDSPLNLESDVCKVKLEPVDIQRMLDELGDGFVSTVFDIQDPSLAIEISSDDSSDGEN